MWIEENAIPWALYKTISHVITGVDSVIIPDEYIMEETQPGFDHFAYRYGADPPTTPPNTETTISRNLDAAGTLHTAQLQQSSSSSQQAQSSRPTSPTGQVSTLQVVAGDISQLSRDEPLHDSDIMRVYTSMLTSIFQSNDNTLSHKLSVELIDKTINQQNKLNITQLWNQDWLIATNRGIVEKNFSFLSYPLRFFVDTLISDHSHHTGLNSTDI